MLFLILEICAVPRNLPSNVIVTDLTTPAVGDEISFVCKSGFVIVGDKTSTCQENGQFSSFSVECKARGEINFNHYKSA